MIRLYALLVLNFLCIFVNAQTTGDYRSRATGAWNSTSTWERWNGSTWSTSPPVPLVSDGVITIMSTHVVTIPSAVTVSQDNIVINSGSQLINNGTLSMQSGTPAFEIDVTGQFINTSSVTFAAGALMRLNAAAIYVHNSVSSASAISSVTTMNATSTWYFRATTTVTNPNVSLAGNYGNIYFQNFSNLSWSLLLSGANDITCNDFFTDTVTPTTNQYTGQITIGGNFSINSTLTNSTGSQRFVFTGANKTISAFTSSYLNQFYDSLTIASTANITLNNSFTAANGSVFLVYGRLNTANATITGNATSSIFRLYKNSTVAFARGSLTNSVFSFTTTSAEDSVSYEVTSQTSTPQLLFWNYNLKNLTINTAAGLTTTMFSPTTVRIYGTLTLTSGTFNLQNSTLGLYGAPIAGNSNNLTCNQFGLFLFYGTTAGHFLPASISQCGYLVMANPNGVTLNANLTITQRLDLTNGILNCGAFTVTITDTVNGRYTGGSASSFVNGTLSLLTKVNTNSITYPVGAGTFYLPVTFPNLLSNAATFLKLKAFASTPAGTGDNVILFSMANRYWNMATSGSNNIGILGTVTLQPNGIVPSLGSGLRVAVSTTNGANSFSSLGGSVSSPNISSTSNFLPAHISDLTSIDGTFISIGNANRPGGVYCVGPSASYTPPSGVTYQNPTTPYPTLTAAIAALNANSFDGSVVFELQNNYVSTSETFPITITFQGTPTLTAVIRPRIDVPSVITISGSIAGFNSSLGMITFNGADYVTIDGSPGGTLGNIIRLGITNTGNGSQSNIIFTNDAQHNTINAVTSKAINFATNISIASTNLSSGNDNITIKNCELTNQTSNNSVTNQILVNGAISGNSNDSILITYNKISNSTTGVNSSGGFNSLFISNNHFFNTVAGSTTLMSAPIAITSNQISSTSITGNFIGGADSTAIGSPMFLSGLGTSNMIRINSPYSGSSNIISGNTIKNINIGVSADLYGISVAGKATISSNVIGQSGSGITFLNTNTSTTAFTGISVTNSTTNFSTDVSGNAIQNIISNAAPGAVGNFRAIIVTNIAGGSASVTSNSVKTIQWNHTGDMFVIEVKNGGSPAGTSSILNNKMEAITETNGLFFGIFNWIPPATISGNRIGNWNVANDITSATSGGSVIYCAGTTGLMTVENDTIANLNYTGTGNYIVTGINLYYTSGGNHVVQRNVIKNISSASALAGSETGDVSVSALNGIYNQNGNPSQLLKYNTISGLYLTNTNAVNASVVGIFQSGACAVSNNLIYDLRNAGTNTSTLPTIFGIKNNYGFANYILNNMISLGNGTNTNGVNMYGIFNYTASGTNTVEFNNVLMSGAANTGRSSAMWVHSTAGANIIINNIFSTIRTGTSKNYAIGFNSGNAPNWGSSNYNVLYSANAATLGAWPGTTDQTYNSWKTISGGEFNSLNIQPTFTNNANDLHLAEVTTNCPFIGAGGSAIVSTDFDDQVRSTPPTIGADESVSVCLVAGVYCIGPAASYTPPAGVIYRNATNPFPTVTAAVNSLNSNLFLGVPVFEIQNDYASVGEVFPITITFQGNSSFQVKFRPRSDAASVVYITGSLSSTNNSEGLIQLNGADYITFDGSPGGTLGTTSRLGIRCTGSSGVSTMFISNDARNNTINAMTCEASANSRSIYIGGTAGPSGNDNLIISNCMMKNAVGNFADYHIYSDGSGTLAAANTGWSFTNNKFTDAATGGIRITDGINGSLIVSGNHFYQTTSFVNISNGIILVSSSASQITVSNNYYGGTAPFAGGSQMTLNNQGAVYPILVNNAVSGASNIISSNVIQNIIIGNMLNNNGLQGINVSGPATITNNMIGDTITTNSILFNSTNFSFADFYGINVNASGVSSNSTLTGNIIQNITINAAAGVISTVKGIRYLNTNTAHTVTVSGNAIGQLNITNSSYLTLLDILGPNVASGNTIVQNNKMETISTGSFCEFLGMFVTSRPATVTGNRIGRYNVTGDVSLGGDHYSVGMWLTGTAGLLTAEDDTVTSIALNGTGAYTFSGMTVDNSGAFAHSIKRNIIYNISTNSTINGTITSTVDSIAMTGINYALISAPSAQLQSNIINRLICNATTGSVSVVGIYSTGLGTISRNNVVNLATYAVSAGNKPLLAGIYNNSNGNTVANNMIAMVNDDFNEVNMYGIADVHTTGGINNYYFNTVLVGGTTNGSNDRSYCYYKYGNSGGQLIRNNIFENSRAGSGKGYALGTAVASSSVWTSTSCNYNCLYSSNAATIGSWGVTDKTFANWKTITGGDNNSFQFLPDYVNGVFDMHIAPLSFNCALSGKGIIIAGLTTDFDGDSRNNPPTVGADEISFACNVDLNVRAYIQGYFRGTKMTPVLYNLNLTTDSTICDTVRIELHNSFSPYALNSAYTTVIKTDGNVYISLPFSLVNQSYYIVIKHRNSLETWSASPYLLSSGTNLLNFTSAANTAYSSNQIHLGSGVYAIYSGDVNNSSNTGIQDGIINLNDLNGVQNNCVLFTRNYTLYDLTGDLVTESADFSMIENNYLNGAISVAKP